MTDEANLGNEEQAMSILDNSSCQVLQKGMEFVRVNGSSMVARLTFYKFPKPRLKKSQYPKKS